MCDYNSNIRKRKRRTVVWCYIFFTPSAKWAFHSWPTTDRCKFAWFYDISDYIDHDEWNVVIYTEGQALLVFSVCLAQVEKNNTQMNSRFNWHEKCRVKCLCLWCEHTILSGPVQECTRFYTLLHWQSAKMKASDCIAFWYTEVEEWICLPRL